MSNALVAAGDFDQEQLALMKRTICKGSTDDEFALFVAQCRRTRLDPFSRQICAVKRWDSREKREVMQVQTTVDGYRLIAERTGKYEGQLGPFWCGGDGEWKDVWLADEPPSAAKVGVWKTGCREPTWYVAHWAESAQWYKPRDSGEQRLTPMWERMPALMLAKVAESQALRKAFPHDLSGLYTDAEITTEPEAIEGAPHRQAMPKPPSGEYVTPEQAREIDGLLAEAKADVSRFLWHYGIKLTTELTTGQYAEAKELLGRKRAAAQPAAATGGPTPEQNKLFKDYRDRLNLSPVDVDRLVAEFGGEGWAGLSEEKAGLLLLHLSAVWGDRQREQKEKKQTAGRPG